MIILLILSGCTATVAVREVNPSATLRDQLNTRLTSANLSSMTRSAIARLALEDRVRSDPADAVHALRQMADEDPDAAWRIAASELLLDMAESTTPATRRSTWPAPVRPISSCSARFALRAACSTRAPSSPPTCTIAPSLDS